MKLANKMEMTISHFNFQILKSNSGEYELILSVPNCPRDYYFRQTGFTSPGDALKAAELAEQIFDKADFVPDIADDDKNLCVDRRADETKNPNAEIFAPD